MSAKIVAAFPCCGKSYMQMTNSNILYNKSGTFRWTLRHYTEEELDEMRKIWDNVPHLLSTDVYINKLRRQKFNLKNLDFPNNYIQNIKDNLNTYDYIFVSTHEWITNLLDDNNLDYTLVYPKMKCKCEWLGRIYVQDTSSSLINIINKNWDVLIHKLDKLSETHNSIRLDYGQYLSDVINRI